MVDVVVVGVVGVVSVVGVVAVVGVIVVIVAASAAVDVINVVIVVVVVVVVFSEGELVMILSNLKARIYIVLARNFLAHPSQTLGNRERFICQFPLWASDKPYSKTERRFGLYLNSATF